MSDHLVRGRYRPVETVGHGGEGEVVRMIDLVHRRQLALKVRRLKDGAAGERLLEEARILLGLRPHPNLPLVREDFVEGDLYFIAMDWIEGRSLRQVLREEGSPGLPLPEVLSYLDQAADALDHLHDHDPPVVHLDVKPANLILTGDGRVVLVDFGISTCWEGANRRGHGTPDYAAPELGAGVPTPASDVYGLAATAYALLTGAPPGPGVRPHIPGVSDQQASRLLQAIRRGLSTNPAFRPPSGAALVEAIRAAGGGAATPRRARLRRRRHVGAAVAVTLALLGAATWYLNRDGRAVTILEIGQAPASLAIDSATNRFYVAELGSERVVVLDAGTHRELARVRLPSPPLLVGVNPARNRVYVADSANRLAVLDGESYKTIGGVDLGSRPRALAVKPENDSIYVVGHDPDAILVVEDRGGELRVVSEIPLASQPWAVAVSPQHEPVYLAAQDPDRLVVKGPGATIEEFPIPGSSQPCGIALSPNLYRVYPAMSSGMVSVFDGLSNGHLTSVAVPAGSCAIALDPRTNNAYLAGGAPATLTVIDLISNQVESSRPIGGAAGSTVSGIAADLETGRVYVLLREPGGVAVFNGRTLSEQRGPLAAPAQPRPGAPPSRPAFPPAGGQPMSPFGKKSVTSEMANSGDGEDPASRNEWEESPQLCEPVGGSPIRGRFV